MAPRIRKVAKKNDSRFNKFRLFLTRYATVQTFKKLVFDNSMLWVTALFLILLEIVLNLFVIWRIKYTEIDWIAYMQEVEGVVNGTFDYSQLKGDTGPLVYPAGFVYVYTALYYVTDHGRNIRLAQYIFAVLYILTLIAVFRIYDRSKQVPPYALIFMCCTSYRIHSIFVLRLFNDPIAMLIFYISVNYFLSHKWTLGCVLYSFAVSIKMNVLLFAPGVLVVLLASLGFTKTVWNLFLCALVQVVLAVPFLLANPLAYLSRSFDFGRVFLHEWTVNWRFLPEDVFVNRYFHSVLLLLHLLVLILFAATHWSGLIKLSWKRPAKVVLSTNSLIRCLPILMPLFTANVIGIVFSRSLHYQFYVWYFHTLPYLLWSTSFPVLLKISMLGVLELAWNTFPSTVASSCALHICHIQILAGIWWSVPRHIVFKGKGH